MLILASASEARHRLLKQASIPHKIIISNFDEYSIKENNPKNLSQRLATEKAKKVSSMLTGNPSTLLPSILIANILP